MSTMWKVLAKGFPDTGGFAAGAVNDKNKTMEIIALISNILP